MRLALLLVAAVILIRDPTGKWAGDPLQPWFESLRNKLGLYCCAEADGHVLDDGEWDTKDAMGLRRPEITLGKTVRKSH